MEKKALIRRMGGSLGLTLPKEMTDDLHLRDGDEVHLVRTEQGLLLTSFDPDFDETMQAFDVIRRKYRNAFRELAK